jgi:hypothetical protein
MIRSLSRAVAVAALLSGALAGSASAASFEKAIWGPVRTPSGSSAFRIYHRLGVDTFEIQLAWADVARWRPRTATDPRDPAYRWPAELRDAIRLARSSGIRVAVMVKGTPGWANGGQNVTVPPTADADLADFFTAAVAHYPSVRRWMVWGEPSRLENWSPIPVHAATAPRRYATLLDAAYRAIKKADPRSIVIGGMTFTAGEVLPGEWVRFMRLPNGRPPHMDWWGHNPYTPRKPDIRLDPYFTDGRDMSDIDTLAAEISQTYRRARMRVPRLWLSEFNISSDRANRAFSFFVTRPEQAVWVTDAYAIAKRQKVAGLGWYGLYDEPESVKNGFTFGLLQADGRAKPAYDAFRRVRSAAPPGR